MKGALTSQGPALGKHMELSTTRIFARSHLQAMDWSLVLVSQGIESILDFSEEAAGWGLVVAAQDYDRALGILHQYQLENRRWPWRHKVVLPGFLFDWAALAWAGLLGVFFWLNSTHNELRAVGLMDSTETVRGQWWRLFTAIWLHADVAHLAANATLGFVLLGLAMGRYGTGIGLLAAYLGGAGGNLLAWWLSAGPHRSLGASGMVMASLGLLAVPFFSGWR
ncbi:MAG TPA: rhomboid family intramembrane serine protease, partial [Candidatus Sulfotelmatobacter sp.]|nr:rhomboid family intramembrane serine protease [Candidatus Sulfotelmatobacter sp.]